MYVYVCMYVCMYIGFKGSTALPRSVPLPVSIRQHTSAYVSKRQHTSAYVSIPRCLGPSLVPSRNRQW